MCRVFYTFVDINDDLSPKEKRKISSDIAYKLLFKGAKLCGFDICEQTIIRSENGKPYVKNGAFFFSISHSDEFVCVAISDHEVGIDTQKIGDVSDEVVRRFVKKQPGSAVENTYFWTDYEAVGKYFGVGIPHSLELSSDMQILRFQCQNYCISVCLSKGEECLPPEGIISIKDQSTIY